MKKRVLCIALAVVLLFSLSMSAFAAQSDVSIVIDNKEVEFTASSGEPFVDANGRTQVPLRVVMEQYGCDVEWDSANNAAVITKGNTTVIVPIGQSYILVNGKSVAMDTAALVQNGRTYLPIRAVLEAFGADVEWDNGKVSVTSPASGEFENIYIDENGNLIFELANGNKINAGSVSNGKDGKDGRDGSDGVSVVNAYVDGSGNLMIALSNGRTINAGNVGVGGSMSGLTFADYSVGTKFYLTQPTGAFDVTVYVENTPYVVEFDSVYYELTAKHSYNDADAWKYGDGNTTFQPYDVTMYVSGQMDKALAGKYITVTFGDVITGSWYYKGSIAADGTFQITQAQESWRSPKSLILSKVVIGDGSSTPNIPDTPSVDPTPNPDDMDDAVAEILAVVAGTWQVPSNSSRVITVKEDGTIIYNGTGYTPQYDVKDNVLIAVLGNDYDIYFDVNEYSARVYGNGEEIYYMIGSWETITLTKDNFFNYYEYQEAFKINYNGFGEFESADIQYYYVLKDLYASKLVDEAYDQTNGSTVSAKIQLDRYTMQYSIDLDEETYTVIEPGELFSSNTYTRDDDFGVNSLFLTNTILNSSEGSNQFPQIKFIDATGTLYLKIYS